MGMYTELVFASALKKETPKEVINVLNSMVTGTTEYIEKNDLPNHDLFKCDRWHYLFTMDSYYFDGETMSKLTYDEISKNYYLTIRSNLKNYNNEIEKFLDFINPYLDKYEGDFLGYYRYEECRDPELIYYEDLK